MKLGAVPDIWHFFNSWLDGSVFCLTFHMFGIRPFSNYMRKIGQIPVSAYALIDQCGLQGMSFFTRPTMPLSKRTLIPCGCVEDFVRTSLTIPSVRFPDRWSCFCTTLTCVPGLMSALMILFICITYTFKGLAFPVYDSLEMISPRRESLGIEEKSWWSVYNYNVNIHCTSW